MNLLRWSIALASVAGLLAWVAYSASSGNSRRGDNMSEPTRSPAPPAGGAARANQAGAPAVTPETLGRAGFKKQDGGYAHPQITVGELKRVLGFRPEDIQEIPNGPAGSPRGEVEFCGGRCHLDYAWMLLEPRDGLQDETNKVRVYLWFYKQPE